MSSLAHDIYLNAYLQRILARARPSNRPMQCVNPRYPVVGGWANLDAEEIAELERAGRPLSKDRIDKGDVLCNHGWKAQGPAKDRQFFCAGWVRQGDCKPGRDPKADGLDCGFHFDAAQAENSCV